MVDVTPASVDSSLLTPDESVQVGALNDTYATISPGGTETDAGDGQLIIVGGVVSALEIIDKRVSIIVTGDGILL